jgi:hypothetical protein
MKTADESSARIVVPAAPLAASYGRRGGTRHVHRCPTEGHPALRFAPYAAASSRMANGEWPTANASRRVAVARLRSRRLIPHLTVGTAPASRRG